MPPSEADARGSRYSVLGTWIRSTDPARTLETVRQWIASGERHYVCLANVHGVMEAHRDPALRAIYNRAGLTVPDGMPLVWVGRAGGHRDVRRVYGPDLMLRLCAAAAAEGWSCYLYGGAPDVPERLGRVLEARFPGLRVAGAFSPPFRALDDTEQAADLRRIDEGRPDIVFVGLGCPKQERWMAAHRAHLRAPVLVGVGAAFDFHTDRVRQAPRWMMSVGLEWLFRLSQEPRRLWRRYLFYNPLFVVLALAQLLGVSRGSDRG